MTEKEEGFHVRYIHRVGFKEGQTLKLINLSIDIAEQNDVSSENPEIVKKLLGYANQMLNDIGDLNVPPSNQRKAGLVKNPVPQL